MGKTDLFAETKYDLSEIERLDFKHYDFLVVTYWQYYNAGVKIKARNPKIRVWFCNTWDEKLSQMALDSGAIVCNPLNVTNSDFRSIHSTHNKHFPCELAHQTFEFKFKE
ncbi:MAG: hypothetical protein ACUVRP_07075 [Chlorobiales bacterium]